jgi:dTMP kinase
MYIVIEGQDGTGKSTQVELLANYLRKKGRAVTTLHEPEGDLPSAIALRKIIKSKSYHLAPITHLLLFTAARLELWQKLATPTLEKGGYVISSRNWLSTLAYQGYGQGIPLATITQTTKKFLPPRYIHPDHPLILTLDTPTRQTRLQSRDQNSPQDTFESKPDSFQSKVAASYLKIAKSFHIPTLDASPPPAKLNHSIIKLFNI